MTFEDFKGIKDLKDFKVYGISVADYYKLPDYYEEHLRNKKTVRIYTQFESFLIGTSDKRFKYMEIEFSDGDEVCIFFRCVDIFSQHSLKLHGIPVSKRGIRMNVLNVIRELFKKDFYCSIVMDKEDCEDLKIGNLKRVRNLENYYSSYDFIKSKYTHKYLQSKRMLNLDRECTVKVTRDRDEVADDILAIEYYWKNDKKGSIREQKAFSNFIRYRGDDIIYFVLYVGDNPLSYEIYVIDGSRAVDFYGKNLCRIENIEEYSKGVLRDRDLMSLTLYSQYRALCEIHKDFGIEEVYYLGSGSMESGVDPLLEFKRKNNEGSIHYYLLDKKSCEF